MNPLHTLPKEPGAYRWIYADASCGDYTAVAIFMIGSVFSSRYVVNASRGISPIAHSSVNFALYRNGVRTAWVLSEYAGAELAHGGGRTTLHIGRSSLSWRPEGPVRIRIHERLQGMGRRRIRARMELWPDCPEGRPLELGAGHIWQPLAARATARLDVPREGVRDVGHGYLDTNHGPEPLGVQLPGWRWLRTHTEEQTQVLYELPEGGAYRVTATEDRVTSERVQVPAPRLRRTAWGLNVPVAFELPGTGEEGAQVLAAARVLESSPFYARLEARNERAHVLGEVADFRRFRSPLVRWMADFRTRVEER